MSDREREMGKGDSMVRLHVYGLNLELRSDDRKTVDGIRRDPAFFETAHVIPGVSIESMIYQD